MLCLIKFCSILPGSGVATLSPAMSSAFSVLECMGLKLHRKAATVH